MKVSKLIAGACCIFICQAVFAQEQQNGKEHPEAGKSRGIPQDLWSQDISVELLQKQDKNQEINAFHRIR